MKLRSMPAVPGLAALALVLTLGPLTGQGKDVEAVRLRVSSSLGGGRIVIDRGDRDLVEKGDIVVIRPRGAAEYRGIVADVRPRHSLVQLQDRTKAPTAGTPGEVWIPKARGVEQPDPKKPPEQKDPPPDTPEKPVFRNQDRKWRSGMTLLGGESPLRPSERPRRTTGRIFALGRYADTDRDTDSDSFLRVGTDLRVENPFGRGGGIRFDGEFDIRNEGQVDGGARNEDLLLRQFSYFSGGSRFDSSGFEVGRFVQRGMAELQVLDGFAWGTRRKNGHRYGASIGFLPEPDEDYQSLKDFQVAAYYHWVVDEAERLTYSAAIQKTWHNGHTDRDLFIGKVRYLPEKGWRINSTVWIDYYDSGEQAKNSGVELTQAFASFNRDYGVGHNLDLSYRRIRHPDILRNEFLKPTLQAIADNRYDRIAINNWNTLTETTRVREEVAYWNDEEDSGGNVELGLETRELFLTGDRLDVTLFALLGEATTSGGGRVSYSVTGARGSWLLSYEYGRHHLRGFPSDRDDLAQHFLRASRSFFLDPGWDITVRGDAYRYDDELSWSIDFYLQKSF